MRLIKLTLNKEENIAMLIGIILVLPVVEYFSYYAESFNFFITL